MFMISRVFFSSSSYRIRFLSLFHNAYKIKWFKFYFAYVFRYFASMHIFSLCRLVLSAYFIGRNIKKKKYWIYIQVCLSALHRLLSGISYCYVEYNYSHQTFELVDCNKRIYVKNHQNLPFIRVVWYFHFVTCRLVYNRWIVRCMYIFLNTFFNFC